MDATRFLRDHGLPVAGPGDRHYAEGWTHTPCPFCAGRSPGNHLGHDGRDPWLCWRCGSHSSAQVVREILGVSWGQATALVGRYGGRGDRMNLTPSRTDFMASGGRSAPLPRGTSGLLSPRHMDYLRDRGFARPEETAHLWRLMGTGATSERPWRLIAPVLDGGQGERRVSWISRDITGKASKRYLPCPKQQEVVPHKHTLYGWHLSPPSGVILVEGVVDAWRVGPGAVAAYGQKLTPEQLLILIRGGVRKVGVFLDPDARASSQALCSVLGAAGLGVKEILADTDPGDLSEAEVKEIREGFFQEG